MLKKYNKFLFSITITVIFFCTIILAVSTNIKADTAIPLTGLKIKSYSFWGYYPKNYSYETTSNPMVIYGSRGYFTVHYWGQTQSRDTIKVDGEAINTSNYSDFDNKTTKQDSYRRALEFESTYDIKLTSGSHTISIRAMDMYSGTWYRDNITVNVIADKVLNTEKNIPINKVWTINFTQPLSTNNNFQQNAQIVKIDGRSATPVPGFTYSLSPDYKTLYISPPSQGYVSSSHYGIIIGDKITNSNNIQLGKRVVKEFFTGSTTLSSINSINLQSSEYIKSPDIDFTVSWDNNLK